MDPITLIVTAVVAGAALAGKDVANQAVRDGYAGLKSLIIRKFGAGSKIESAVDLVEDDPESEARQAILAEEVQKTGADKDAEVVEQAQEVYDTCQQADLTITKHYTAIVKGSGAVAQDGGVAAGAGGVAIKGDVHGPISTGSTSAGEES